MTLTRQLVLLILALMTTVFLGSFAISLGNTRAYLQAQLESHGQDAATSLGLSITSHMAGNDVASVSSMVDAIFDSGFYSSIIVEDANAKILVERRLAQGIKGVPTWFVKAITLEPPEGEAFVMAGWRQAGRVRVVSHPAFAYIQLWTSAVDTFWWFLFSTLALGAAAIGLLRVVLKPLRTVEWQANSICNREFPLVEDLPKTPDLRRIVIAMNRMTLKVKTMLADLEAMANRFREQALQHPVTGLANRRYFIDTLEHRIASEEEFQQGALLLIQLKNFKSYNDRHGYPAGDVYLCAAAGVLQGVGEVNPKYTLAHLSGADFAILAEDVSCPEAEELARGLAERLAQLTDEEGAILNDVGHVGVAYFEPGQNSSELFSNADMALRQAQTQGPNAWNLLVPEGVARVRTGGEWKEFVEAALTKGDLVLHTQPVVACGSRGEMHREVFVRLRDTMAGDGKAALIAAGSFMPMVERFGMTEEVDKAVIREAMKLLKATPGNGQLAINVSPLSIRSLSFVRWLEETLKTNPLSRRIIFELPEYGAVTMLEELHDVIERFAVYGARFSLDHFGRGFSSFAYLHSLKVDYLKIDGSFVRQLGDKDHEFYIRSLTEIAHSLDIQVIAESIESEAVWRWLQGLNLDGGQGYFLGRPA
ncbi:MAG: EAL domain-containing protein [Gammaproteobacteria bacterium]|nr:EAL domain-containing protein [Gammaproteobacteria bacterium]MBU1656041.1 EAL domain-containing protein [Gammaproteobacteria bacterium]MBU1960282.1 EAL domain-containing protein [Gammaproteobacteria bacterium]